MSEEVKKENEEVQDVEATEEVVKDISDEEKFVSLDEEFKWD